MNRPYGQKNNQRQHVDDFDITSSSFVGEGSPLPKEKQTSMQKTGGATPPLQSNSSSNQHNDEISVPYRRVDMVKHFACRDRRPRRSENERILKLHPAIIGSHVKSKRFFLHGPSKGYRRRSLQA